jgi:hypothetical protein
VKNDPRAAPSSNIARIRFALNEQTRHIELIAESIFGGDRVLTTFNAATATYKGLELLALARRVQAARSI